MILIACDGASKNPDPPLQGELQSGVAPSLSFNYPLDGDVLSADEDVSVLVSANDENGSIANVELFINDISLRLRQ